MVITILLIIYIAYSEWMHIRHIHDLELKLLAKTPIEYKQYLDIEKPKKVVKKKEDELIDPEDARPEDFLNGIK